MHKDKAKEIHAAMASLPSQEKEDGVAMTITWSTQVRASTSAERQYAKATMKAASCTGISTTHRGLNIREDFADSMPFIAGKLKETCQYQCAVRVSDFGESLSRMELSVHQSTPDDISLLVFARYCVQLGVLFVC